MSIAEPLNPETLTKGCWKRKGSEEEGEDSNSKVKKAKYSWYFTLESESPQPTSSDEDESIYSIQEQETEFVQDTSDTSTHTWITSSEDPMAEEYEPASLSANENPFIDCLTSSDPELEVSHLAGYVGAIAAAIYESDAGLADDSDDSLTSRDSEISRADYWTCIQCNNVNNKPFFRFCEKCYQERKLFLPPRPKGRRRKKQSKKRRVRALEGQESTSHDSGLGTQSTMCFDLRRTSDLEKLSSSELPRQSSSGLASLSQDSGISDALSQPTSSLDSQRDMSIEDTTKEINEAEKAVEDDLTNYGSQKSGQSLATTLSVSEKNSDLSDEINEIDLFEKIRIAAKKAKPRNEPDNTLCLFCTVGPKNAVFVHGRDSHICCCYRCAMRVWKTTKHCPVCKRKVTNVIKTYYV